MYCSHFGERTAQKPGHSVQVWLFHAIPIDKFSEFRIIKKLGLHERVNKGLTGPLKGKKTGTRQKSEGRVFKN